MTLHPYRQGYVIGGLLIPFMALFLLIFLFPPLTASALPENQQPDGTCNAGFQRVDGNCTPSSSPEHSYLTGLSYGRGWECHYGYALEEDTCAAIFVPENAYLDYSGTRWTCDRGYTRDRETCALIDLPDNAYLTDSGYNTGWACERGFVEDDLDCIAIEVPDNAYLTSSRYGQGWACERGYLQAAQSCIEVVIPENAHLNYSGNGWQCNRPFSNVGDRCEMP